MFEINTLVLNPVQQTQIINLIFNTSPQRLFDESTFFEFQLFTRLALQAGGVRVVCFILILNDFLIVGGISVRMPSCYYIQQIVKNFTFADSKNLT